MRRIAYIVLGAVGIGGVLLAGYYFSSTRGGNVAGAPYENTGNLPSLPTSNSPVNLPATGVPIAGGTAGAGQKFGMVAQNPIVDYFVDKQNNLLLIQPDGQIIKVTGTNQTVVSGSAVNNLISASFSYDGAKVLVVFGEGAAPQTSVFDMAKKTWSPLSTDIKNPVWSPSDYRIAFLSSNSKSFAVLATLDLKQTKPAAQPLLQLHAQDLAVSWSSPNSIFLAEKPSSYAKSSVWQFDIKNRALVLAQDSDWGLMTAWNNNATRGVAFVSDRGNRGGALYLVTPDDKRISRFDIVTLPSKCVFDIATIKTTSTKAAAPKVERLLYCGFPQNAQKFNLNAQPDAYLERDYYSTDYFYKIDLDTGVLQNLIPDLAYDLDGTNLKVASGRLFFVNRYDERLYSILLN